MATLCLANLAKLANEGELIRFDHFMNLALYHPEWGYYSAEPTQIGRSGDFFTSVSTGGMFGKLIAHHIAQWHAKNAIVGSWRILEPGPNNGQLARDIVQTLKNDFPTIIESLQYITIDPLPVPLAWQRHNLAELAPTVQCLESLKNLIPLPSFLIANEILDALPCRLFERKNSIWHEIYVKYDNTVLREELIPLNAENTPPILIHSDLPADYRTEYRDNWHRLLDPLLHCISFGSLLWIDYGFAAPEYYHPARTKGTLRTYDKHQAGDNPLEKVGECDITAHVDFTSFAAYAAQKNCSIQNFEPQEFFLTRVASTLPIEPSMTPAEIRQLQTLIHPAQMGARFHVLELNYPHANNHNARALTRLAMDDSPL